MAELQIKGVVKDEEDLLHGHKIMYLFHVHRLDIIDRSFCPLEYKTRCRSIPTNWDVQLNYERIVMNDETYTFSIKLTRTDSLIYRVKASVVVTFTDDHESPVYLPLTASKERMISGDELEAELDGIFPETLGSVSIVEAAITISRCHAPSSGFQFASTLKNRRNFPKL